MAGIWGGGREKAFTCFVLCLRCRAAVQPALNRRAAAVQEKIMSRTMLRAIWFRGLYALLLCVALRQTFFPAPVYSIADPYALGAAINNKDAWAVSRLLLQGASPNGTDDPARYESWGERLLAGLYLKPHSHLGTPDVELAIMDYVDHGNGNIRREPRAQQNHRILQMLLEHGGSPNARKFFPGSLLRIPLWDSPLMLAAQAHDLTACRLLLDHHAEVNVGTAYSAIPDGASPLDQAAMEGDCEIMRLLLDRGANIEAHHMFGTPLITAVEFQQADAVRLLVARGANLDARDARGYTALREAQTGGPNTDNKRQIVEILQKAEARKQLH